MRLRRLEPVLREALRASCFVPPGGRLLVAVSGGADSTALLRGLVRIAPEFGLTMSAAHLHHGLRGAAADADLDFVRSLCDRLGLPLDWARWDTRARMRRRGLSGQAGLRTLRREFLMAAARRASASAISTAHTADDQLETVLLRLLRGTGLPGLGGMRPRRGLWIKPMLGITREAIEADLRRAGEPWREDASNLDLHYARNRLRHDAIPALMRVLGRDRDPGRSRSGLALRVSSAAAEARGAHHWIQSLARADRTSLCRIESDHLAIDSGELASRPAPLRIAILRSAWRELAPRGIGLTSRHLNGLRALGRSGRSHGRIELPAGFHAEREGVWIRIGRDLPKSTPETIRLEVPGQAQWAGCTFEGRWITGRGAMERLPGKSGTEEYFAADDIDGGLELRVAGADERFVPFGSRRPVLLREFLSRQSVRGGWRHHPRVLADAGGILWVVGVRRSARAPVTVATRRALWVHAERND